MVKTYTVVREYSKVTANKPLWMPLSRPFTELQSAIDWLDFQESEYKKKYPKTTKRFFIVTHEEIEIPAYRYLDKDDKVCIEPKKVLNTFCR